MVEGSTRCFDTHLSPAIDPEAFKGGSQDDKPTENERLGFWFLGLFSFPRAQSMEFVGKLTWDKQSTQSGSTSTKLAANAWKNSMEPDFYASYLDLRTSVLHSSSRNYSVPHKMSVMTRKNLPVKRIIITGARPRSLPAQTSRAMYSALACSCFHPP
jgi:hypothetical protein